jgi:hypothetical protein
MDVQLAHANAPAGEAAAASTAATAMTPAANGAGSSSNSSSTGSSQQPGNQGIDTPQADSSQQSQPQTLRSSTSNADMTSSGSSSSGDDPEASAPAASSSSKKPTKQQQLFDALDGASLALTTASLGLSAALCALCLNNASLAWAGVVLLGFIVAAPVVVGALILARNHWLVVALRYCLSVAALQRDSGLGFASVRSRILRLALSGLSSCLLSMVGLVVALYLTACYVVSFSSHAAVQCCCTEFAGASMCLIAHADCLVVLLCDCSMQLTRFFQGGVGDVAVGCESCLCSMIHAFCAVTRNCSKHDHCMQT